MAGRNSSTRCLDLKSYHILLKNESRSDGLINVYFHTRLVSSRLLCCLHSRHHGLYYLQLKPDASIHWHSTRLRYTPHASKIGNTEITHKTAMKLFSVLSLFLVILSVSRLRVVPIFLRDSRASETRARVKITESPH